MSDEITPIAGFGQMRPMSPYYGGADLTTPIPGEGITPAGPLTGYAQQGSQVAMGEQIPAFETAPSPEVAAAGSPLPSRLQNLLENPATHQQFCSEFHDYIKQMYPESMMPLDGADKPPKMGGGLPSLPAGTFNSSVYGNQAASQSSNVPNYATAGFDELSLSGSLDDRISQLQNAIQGLEGKSSQIEAEIQQLETLIQDLQNQLQQLETEKREIETQKQQKQQELNQAQQEQQKLQQQKQDLTSQQSMLNNHKQMLSSQIQALTGQIASLTTQISTLKASAASMHAQAAALLANPYTAAAGAAMEAGAMEMDAQAAVLEGQKIALQAQKQQAECQLQQVEAQLQQIATQLQQVESQLQTVGSKISQIQNAIAELDRKLQEMDQKIAQLNDQLNEKKRELADKKAELAQIKLKIGRAKELLQMYSIDKEQREKGARSINGGGEPDGAARLMDPLSLLGGLGALGGTPMGYTGKNRTAAADDETRAKEALTAEFPGGTIDMRAQSPDPTREVSQYGTEANTQQVEQMLEQVASKYGIPADVMKAVAWNDSKFNVKSQSSDGDVRGAVHVAPKLNPDYDVARGNQNPAYNLEFSARKLRNHFEKTQDWKMATSSFYGKDAPALAMGAQVMAFSTQRPWETATQNMTADSGSGAPKTGAKRG